MVWKFRRYCVLGLVMTLSPCANTMGATADDSLSVGIFPRRNAIETTHMFTPMVKYLAKRLDRDVSLVTTKDFQTFWHNLQDQKYDLVHYNQYHYVKTHEDLGYRVILKNIEFGESTIAGSVLVRRDAGINSVEDLKGKKILFGGGPKAMQSYIVASYLLQQQGLSKKDYTEAFAKNPPNAILATYYGRAHGAGAGDKVLRLGIVTNQIDISKMKYLVKGEQLPHLPWAVKKNLPDDVARQIQSILSNLNEHADGRAILNKAKLDGMAVANDEEYDRHRLIIEKVLGEKY